MLKIKNMKDLLIKIKEIGYRKLFAILILGATDAFVIAAPYYLKSVIPNLSDYIQISERQLAIGTSILGYVTLFSQLPGGWLADKFSSKKLLILAAFFTGILVIWFATLVLKQQIPNRIIQYYVINAAWGISTTPFFWTPLWKLVSQQGDKKNQGFIYGLQGSLNGVVGIFFIFGFGAIVTFLIRGNDSKFMININPKLFASYIYVTGVMLLLCSLGIYFFVIEKPSTEKFALDIKNFCRVLSSWKPWALSFFLLGMYMFQSTFAFFLNQMLINTIGISFVALTILGGIRAYFMRFLVSAFIGKIADRVKSITGLLLAVLLFGFVIIAIFLFTPGISTDKNVNVFDSLNPTYKIFATWSMYILFLISSFLSWIMVTLRYVQVAEVPRPSNSYGSVVALMSFIGFSSDSWFYQFSAAIIKDYQIIKTPGGEGVTSQTGYQIILGLGLIISFIGWIAGFIVFLNNWRFNKKHKIRFYRWRELNNA